MNESNQRPSCCGTFAQQQMRVAKFDQLIENLSTVNSGEARRILHHAQQTKARIEKWIAAHSHGPARPLQSDAAWQAHVPTINQPAGNGR
jgi:hypothetical protein